MSQTPEAQKRPGGRSRLGGLFSPPAAVCGLLLLAVLVVFGHTVGYGLVHFDDNVYVSENPQVTRGLTAEGIAWAFTTDHAGNWHPLTWLSHMLDCQIFGDSAGGYHATNILLHAATAVVLFLALRRMTGRLWPAAFVAALFAIHPLRVESVVWVAERKDVLSGLFFALCLAAYVGYVRHPFSLARYSLLVALFALGLMAKPMLVTLPFVLLLLDYWPLERFHTEKAARGRRAGKIAWLPVIEKLPLVALSAASCMVTAVVQRQAAAKLEILPLWSRLCNAMVSYATYIAESFWPVALVPLYPHQGKDLPLWQVPVALMILAGISIGVLLYRRKCPYLLVGWCWYLGMLVPVIGLVQVGQQSMADRYTYLPQIGLLIALAWGAMQIIGNWPRRVWLLGGTSALAIAVLMGCAWRQTHFWRNRETLWSHFLECISNNAVAHSSLGAALYDQGRTAEAIAHYRQAMEINPRFKDAYNNLGIALRSQGRLADAAAQFREALRIDSQYRDAHVGLALTLRDAGQIPQAIDHYEEALNIDRNDAGTHNSVGVLLSGQGKFDAAIDHFRRALLIKRDDTMAYNNLGSVYAKQKSFTAAMAEYKKALAIKRDDALTHYNIGAALRDQRQLDEAIAEFKESLRIDPRYADAHTSLGVIFYWQGHLDDAIAHFQKALEMKPNDVMVRVNLGAVYAQQKRFEAAIAEYEKALETSPDDLSAHNNLGAALFNLGRLDDAIVHYRKALEINPKLVDAHNNLANALYRKGNIREAFAQWSDVVRLQPQHIPALNQLAWVLATSPETSMRNGGEAVKLAQRAAKLAGRPDPVLLNTLAAAYAEDGRFAEALQAAGTALQLATQQKDQRLVEAIKARIQLYEAKSPYRELP